MDFRTSLLLVGITFGLKEFDTKSFVSKLQEYHDIYAPATKLPSKDVKRNLTSNTLRRLYNMELLKRRRVKREAKTLSGKQCFRGYKYFYSISKQGIRHFRFLVGAKVSKDKLQDPVKWAKDVMLKRKILHEILKTERPLQMLDVLKLSDEIVDGRSKKRKGGWYNRFPDKRDFRLMKEHVIARILLDRLGIDFDKVIRTLKPLDEAIGENDDVDYSSQVRNYVASMIRTQPEVYRLLKQIADQHLSMPDISDDRKI